MKAVSIAAVLAFSATVALISAAATSAAAPLQLGPFTNSYDDVGINCNGFDIHIQGTETFSVSVSFNSDGSIARVVKHDSAPHDVLTNTVTGKTIIVRAHFDETMTPIPGTDEVTKTIVGFRYLSTDPGEGISLSDVGRITYGDFEQTIVLWEAGKHELATDPDGALCSALA